VIATPLGNREDLSPRALRVLREVPLVACEDTRRTAPLLSAHGVKVRLVSYFEHNEQKRVPALIAHLQEGKDLALVSDAGTPAVSDPGFRLVKEARAQGIPVLPVPGPSALITALSVSGLPTDRFLFLGFLPGRELARKTALEEIKGRKETLVFYESPARVLSTLGDMKAAFGDREAFLCREATKLHEEYVRGTLSALEELLKGRDRVRGEIVLVVSGLTEEAKVPEGEVLDLFARLTAGGRTRSEAVKEVARLTGLPRREVYRRTLQEPDS
jgi:16S rRNA (cytidine1402-2'-O)-methyltransferase